MNSLSDDPMLRQLTDEEITKLRNVFLEGFNDLSLCCQKYGLTVMLIGGSVIGAVRHQGFIPWDDDLDVAMSRRDFEKLKRVFQKELGKKYILSSPNYKNNAHNRFPMILIKDTLLVEAGVSPVSEAAKIKIDIFIIENIPDNAIIRTIKGIWCTALMFMASYACTYEANSPELRRYMCKTKEGKKAYEHRMRIGKLFSFFSTQKWLDIVDRSFQYNKKTKLKGIPSGRGHYFGEIRPSSTFFPVDKAQFEGLTVNIPGNADDYLRNLYGDDYMTLPPEEKRERHFILDIKFKENL
jgi:lipopolysaccharide cholinephosphotransferase